jgi:thiamine kinase-like enzyme
MSEEQQPMLNALNPAAPRLVLIDFEYASYNFRYELIGLILGKL